MSGLLDQLTQLSTWAELATVAGVGVALFVVIRDGRRLRADDRAKRGDLARSVVLEFERIDDGAHPPDGTQHIVAGTIRNFGQRPLLDTRFEEPQAPGIKLAKTIDDEWKLLRRSVIPGDGGEFGVEFCIDGLLD